MYCCYYIKYNRIYRYAVNGMTLGEFRKREILSEETDDIQIKNRRLI